MALMGDSFAVFLPLGELHTGWTSVGVRVCAKGRRCQG